MPLGPAQRVSLGQAQGLLTSAFAASALLNPRWRLLVSLSCASGPLRSPRPSRGNPQATDNFLSTKKTGYEKDGVLTLSAVGGPAGGCTPSTPPTPADTRVNKGGRPVGAC